MLFCNPLHCKRQCTRNGSGWSTGPNPPFRRSLSRLLKTVSTACALTLFAALRAAAHVADSLARLLCAPPSVVSPEAGEVKDRSQSSRKVLRAKAKSSQFLTFLNTLLSELNGVTRALEAQRIPCRVHQVLHQRHDRHRTRSARIRRDPSGDFLHRLEIHIAGEASRTDAPEPDIDYTCAWLHHVGRDEKPAFAGVRARA